MSPWHGLQYNAQRQLRQTQLQAAAQRFFSVFYVWSLDAHAIEFSKAWPPSRSSTSSSWGEYCRSRRLTPPPCRSARPTCPTCDAGSRVRNLTLKRNLSTNVSARHKTQKPPSQANFSTTTRSVEDPPSQQETLSTHVRTLMRSIPHCVVVVTASHSSPLSPSKSPSSSHTRSIKASSPIPTEDFRGMTVSSFNTVTLSPQPIISFNIHLPSTTYDALLSSRQFLVHIVSATKDGAKIADAFTRGNANAEEVFRNLANEGVDVGVLGRGKRRPPVLRGRGVMKVLSCDMLIEKGVPSDGVRVGDHVIVLGKVVGVLVDSGRRGKREGGGSSMEERGLLYVDRGYKEFGRGITIDSGRES